MKPGRILILNHNLREHGTYFRAWKVAELFARRGWRVIFMTTGPQYYRPRRGRRGGIEVWETPNFSPLHHPDEGWSPLGLLWRLHVAFWQRFDIVYSFSHRPVDQFAARLGRRRGAFWICDWCDLYGGNGILAMARERRGPARTRRERLRDTVDRWDERLELEAAADCDLLTVISDYLAQRARDAGQRPERIHKMTSGAETDRINIMDRAACREKLKLQQERKYLGYIANYHPDENLLMDALRIVFSKRRDIDLVAVGNDFYGGEDSLERRGIRDRIRHLGRVPFKIIPVMLGAADAVLVPMTDTDFNRSRWPHKIGDYLAAGRPIAACNVGEVRTFMQKYDVGVGAEPNAQDFARAIIELLDNPEQLRRQGQNARLLAEGEFDWNRILDRLLEKADALIRRGANR